MTSLYSFLTALVYALLGVMVLLFLFLVWFVLLGPREPSQTLPEPATHLSASSKAVSVPELVSEPVPLQSAAEPRNYIGSWAEDAYFEDLEDVLMFAFLECGGKLNATELWKRHKWYGRYHRSKNWIEQTLKNADGYRLVVDAGEGWKEYVVVAPSKIRDEYGHLVSRPRRLKLISSGLWANMDEEE